MPSNSITRQDDQRRYLDLLRRQMVAHDSMTNSAHREARRMQEQQDTFFLPELTATFDRQKRAHRGNDQAMLALSERIAREEDEADEALGSIERDNAEELEQALECLQLAPMLDRGATYEELMDMVDKVDLVTKVLDQKGTIRHRRWDDGVERREQGRERRWKHIERSQKEIDASTAGVVKSLRALAEQSTRQAGSIADYLEGRIRFLQEMVVQISELELKVREQSTKEWQCMDESSLRHSRLEVESLMERKQLELEEIKHRDSHEARVTSDHREHELQVRNQRLEEKRQADRHELDAIEQRMKRRGLLSFLLG